LSIINKINPSLLTQFDNQATETFAAAGENVPAVTIKKLELSLLPTFEQQNKSFFAVADKDAPLTIKKLDASLLSLFEQQPNDWIIADVKQVPTINKNNPSLLSKFEK
jgi:hypothetical protein